MAPLVAGSVVAAWRDSDDLGLDSGTTGIVVWTDGSTMDLVVESLDTQIVGVRCDHPDLAPLVRAPYRTNDGAGTVYGTAPGATHVGILLPVDAPEAWAGYDPADVRDFLARRVASERRPVRYRFGVMWDTHLEPVHSDPARFLTEDRE